MSTCKSTHRLVFLRPSNDKLKALYTFISLFITVMHLKLFQICGEKNRHPLGVGPPAVRSCQHTVLSIAYRLCTFPYIHNICSYVILIIEVLLFLSHILGKSFLSFMATFYMALFIIYLVWSACRRYLSMGLPSRFLHVFRWYINKVLIDSIYLVHSSPLFLRWCYCLA